MTGQSTLLKFSHYVIWKRQWEYIYVSNNEDSDET